MGKQGAWVLAAAASIAMTGVPATTIADPSDPTAAVPLNVIRLPTRAHVWRAGLVKAEEVAEWSALARANLDAAAEELLVQSSAFSLTTLPALSAEESSAIDEFVAVANLATTAFGGSLWPMGVGVQRASADRALGPSLAFLRDRAGADYAFGTFAFQLEQSKRLAAVGSIISLAPLAGVPVYSLPTVSMSYVAMFIADLATGELRWFNVEGGYEVAGVNFSDLREAESARKIVGELLEEYPDDPRTEGDAPERFAGPTRPASPAHGGFEIQAPAGWTVSHDNDVVRATRDGRALNEISVELRDHSRAFLAIGRRSTRYTSSEQLAAWFVVDLERQEEPEYQIIEVSTDSLLVGKPAFRVRYSYRLPVFLGGARVERLTIGTAVPDGLLLASLSAPQLGYFARAVPAFEETVQSTVLKWRR